jgi:hypothetical protein
METELLALSFRGLERLLIVAAAMLSLWGGIMLFLKGVTGVSDAEWKTDTFSVKLFRISPGVFFGLFGAVILVYSVSSGITVAETEEGPQIAYHGVAQDNSLELFQARNTFAKFVNDSMPHISAISESEKQGLIKANRLLQMVQIRQLEAKFGQEFYWYAEMRKNPEALESDDARERYMEIDNYASSTL